MRRIGLSLPMVATWLAIVRVLEVRDRRIARALGGTPASHDRKEKAHALASFKTAA
jgi:hypothetical protein